MSVRRQGIALSSLYAFRTPHGRLEDGLRSTCRAILRYDGENYRSIGRTHDESLYPRQRFSSQVTLDLASVSRYAAAAGDDNPVHHDAAFAASTEATDARVKIRRLIHTIHAVSDIAACRAKYLDILGGLIFAEGYFEAEDRDMALLYVANHMIEPMAPRDPARRDKPFARFLHRHGQCYHSFEIKVDNAPELSAKLKAAGCKLASDYGFFFFVRAESTGGVLLEVCERPMPNDPYDRRNWRPDWSEGHPSTVLRLDHIACVTSDLEAVLGFFTGHLDGQVLADEHVPAPQPGRRILLRLGDTGVAFIQPDNPDIGPLGNFLTPASSGIYTHVWQVEDEARTEAFFHKKGLRTTREACVSPGLAIEPEDFLGARHEFVSAPGSLGSSPKS